MFPQGTVGLLSLLVAVTGLAQDVPRNAPGSLSAMDVDYRALVSRSDLKKLRGRIV